MAFGYRRQIIASVAVAVVLAFTLFAVADTYFPAQQLTQENPTGAGNSDNSMISGTSFSSPTLSQISTSTSGHRNETTQQGYTTETSINLTQCGSNCTIFSPPPWKTYQTLADLKNASYLVVLANVTSEWTLSVRGVPVTFYNITVGMMLFAFTGGSLPPGSALTISQIGGTANGTTINVKGYPKLTKGGTYLFFLNLPIDVPRNVAPYYQDPYSIFPTFTTIGGPQGLFYVQGGKVFSLENLYPQDDSWIPVKADGVPLDQFISEVQSTSTVSTSPIQTLPTLISSQPITSTTENNMSSTSSISQSTLRGIGGIADVRLIYVGTAVAIVIVVAVAVAIFRRLGRLQ